MNQPNGDNFYPLDDDAIAFFAQGVRQIELLRAQISGALQLYVNQHKLEGVWGLADNGREIQRQLDQVPAK